MESSSFTLRWDDDPRVRNNGDASEVVCDTESDHTQGYVQVEQHNTHINSETIIPDTDQIAAENLIYLAQDVVGHFGNYNNSVQYHEELEPGELEAAEEECQVTEEVITDDWVQPGGQERVEVPLDQLVMVTVEQSGEENNIDVPLPTDQDEYTAKRPYPCDFCSRRFRKKANLMNHMVAHQNDRPFVCNLCGTRYVRQCDLLNHLKVHAYVPEENDEVSLEYDLLQEIPTKQRKGNRRRSRISSENGGSFSYSPDAETFVAARTQQYGGQSSSLNNSNSTTVAGAGGSAGGGGGNSSFPIPVAIAANSTNYYPITDPRRPFVCQHCGVGFAREKALASHARIHGGDSPLECNVCGELCWSREQLASHMRAKHPHRSMPNESPTYNDASSEASLVDGADSVNPEIICRFCGAGFQRADLMRRHIKAAHSYKMESSELASDGIGTADGGDQNEDWEGLEHTCNACGEGFRDALDLLAHAESHARSRNNRCMQCGEKFLDEQSMADHVETAHGPLSPATCKRCGRSCRDKRALLKHAQAQHSPPPHTLFCSKCGKSFHNKARLKRHMASHRDKAVVCNICGERFTDGRSLMNHRHSHSGPSARQFPCRECGKTFGSRSSQQIHIRIHTGERPYACRFCWKAFADGGTLRKHERIHTGEKPYACAVCPRAFNQRVVLREHVRSHHSAPDARRGTGAAPFWCAVCGRLLHTSGDLVQHLIQHCDANTAMKRQPQVGPRKYKRRRKLKPHELEYLSNVSDKNESDHSLPESEEPELLIPSPKRRSSQAKKPKKTKATSPPVEDGYSSLMESINNSKRILDSIASGSARTKGKAKGKVPVRPKMIHTQKVKASETELPTRGRRSKAASTTSVTTQLTSATEERVRPRTKNVRYHESGRPPAATFPVIKSEPDTDIAADLREILRAPTPLEPSPPPLPPTPAPTMGRRERIKREPLVEPPSEANHNSVVIVKAEVEDEGPFKCEMCSQAFPLREQLLLHVPIHI